MHLRFLECIRPALQSRLRATDLLHSCSVCTVTTLGYLSGSASREHPQVLNQMCTKWQRNTLGGFRHDKRMNHPNRLALLLKQAAWVSAQTLQLQFTLRCRQSGHPSDWTAFVFVFCKGERVLTVFEHL